jgi:5-methylcytosine-specific restriction endonuclease McrA
MRVWCDRSCIRAFHQAEREASRAGRQRTCQNCGGSMAGKRPQAKWCGDDCREAGRAPRDRDQDRHKARERHKRQRSDGYDASQELWAVCPRCGDLFRLRRQDTRCQRQECQRAARAAATRVHVGAQRVRKAGFDAEVGAFTLREVYDRDGGVCYLCNLPTLADLDDGRQPGSATLDHVVPVESGGSHTLANVRLAHFRCNALKGRKTPDEAREVLARREPPAVPAPDLVVCSLVHTAFSLARRLAEVPRERPGGLPLQHVAADDE